VIKDDRNDGDGAKSVERVYVNGLALTLLLLLGLLRSRCFFALPLGASTASLLAMSSASSAASSFAT
jgi:hypothetical protein